MILKDNLNPGGQQRSENDILAMPGKHFVIFALFY